MSATVWLMLAAVTALGAWLRCSQLDSSAWIDEVLSLSMADGSLAEVYDRLEPQHMPLYFWILSPFIAISDDDAWLRVPSVLLGIGLIPLVFLIGNEVGRPRVGMVAAGLAAISGFLIHYSQEIRMYCLITFLGLLGTWGVVRLSRQPFGPPARWGWLILVLASVLNLYSSPFSVFMVAAHWIVVGGLAWSSRQMLKPYLIFGALVALLYIPGLIHIYAMVDGSAPVVSGKAWPYDDLYRLHNMTLFHFAGLVVSLQIPLIVGSVFGAIVAFRGARVLPLLAVLAFFLPLLSFHLLEPKHFYNPRYLSYAQPHLLLLVGVSLVWVWDQSIGRWNVAKHMAMVGPLCTGIAAVSLAVTLAPSSEINGRAADWKGIARTILDGQHDSARPDLVVIEPKWDGNALLYNMDLVSPSGLRMRLLEGSSTTVYIKRRRRRLRAQSPELFEGPSIRFLAKNNMADLASIADDHHGRIWAITTQAPRLLRQIGFKRVYRMPRFLSYSGGNPTRGPALFMRPAK